MPAYFHRTLCSVAIIVKARAISLMRSDSGISNPLVKVAVEKGWARRGTGCFHRFRRIPMPDFAANNHFAWIPCRVKSLLYTHGLIWLAIGLTAG
jgi:hypothetical protein